MRHLRVFACGTVAFIVNFVALLQFSRTLPQFATQLSARLKGKLHCTVVQPAMMYCLETMALTKRQEAKLEVAEMRIHK